MSKINRREKVIVAMIMVVVLLAIPETIFKFRHPCLTDTERIQHFFDAIQFKHYPDLCKPR
jgi:hypothetical protein